MPAAGKRDPVRPAKKLGNDHMLLRNDKPRKNPSEGSDLGFALRNSTSNQRHGALTLTEGSSADA